MTAAEVAAALRIPPDLLADEGWRDAADAEVRATLGYHGHRGCDLSGILLPIRHPRTGERLGDLCRVAHPPTGAPRYLQPQACRWLYIPPVPGEWLDDLAVPGVVVEGPKSALALLALAQRHDRRLVPIACGGCWGWRRNDGFRDLPNGGHEPRSSPSPSLDWIAWPGRDAIIALDGDSRANPKVAAALRALAGELAGRGANVRVVAIPAVAGDKAGPDDVLAACGDDAALAMLDAARSWPECAAAQAEAAVGALEAADKDARRAAEPPTAEIAAVADPALRARFIGRIAALKIPGVTKADLEGQVAAGLAAAAERRAQAAEAARVGRLLGMAVDPAALVVDLEVYFSRRAHLPGGGAVTLALWAMLTHCIAPFSTAPYLCLESALPDCGKSTVLDLLEGVCARAEQCSGLTRAVLVRTIEANHPTVLLDQGEWLRDKKDETGIMGVLLAGYRRGKPYRCVEGESRELATFDTFGPKAFCAVGGLTGALLSRCLVLHMERLPAGVELESAEPEDLVAVAAPLKERIEAFALQAAQAIEAVKASRPKGGHWPQFTTRERQLWTPPLTIARVCGPETERRAVAAAEELSGRKAEAAAENPRVAKTVALAEVLSAWPAEKFSPGDLVAALAETEAWGEALGEKLKKDDTRKAAANLIGHFVRDFRLLSRERPHGKTLYSTAEALAKATQHLPRTPKTSAASAAPAAEPPKSRGSQAADAPKPSAAPPPPSAATPSAANGQGNHAADHRPPAADAERDFGRSAASEPRANRGVAAGAADAADETGVDADTTSGPMREPGEDDPGLWQPGPQTEWGSDL